jgi:hypothetical protein
LSVATIHPINPAIMFLENFRELGGIMMKSLKEYEEETLYTYFFRNKSDKKEEQHSNSSKK